MKRVLSLAVFAVVAFGAGLHGQDSPADLKKIQGTWMPIKGTFDGVEAPAALLKDRLWVVNDDQLSELVKGRRENRATLRLDSSKKPAALDLGYSEGPARGQVGTGIYKFDGDSLTICIVVPGERPAEFTCPPGSGRALIVFQRAK